MPYLVLGANAARYFGDSTRYGVDASVESPWIILRGEYVGQHRDIADNADDKGWYALAAAPLRPWLQPVFKYEWFDRPGVAPAGTPEEPGLDRGRQSVSLGPDHPAHPGVRLPQGGRARESARASAWLRPKSSSEATASPFYRHSTNIAAMDPLSDLLRVVRLDGAFFYAVEAAEPWIVESAPAKELRPQILPASEHLISYHILTGGHCFVRLIGEDRSRCCRAT